MRMRVRRSGGIAGVSLHGETDIGDAEQPDVRAFVDAVRSAAASAGNAAARDTFMYHVTLDDEPELTIAESALPAGVRKRIEQALAD